MDAGRTFGGEVAAASIPPFFDSTLMAWDDIVIIGGPLGALCWFGWGRPAVRRYGVSGEKGLVTGDDYP